MTKKTLGGLSSGLGDMDLPDMSSLSRKGGGLDALFGVNSNEEVKVQGASSINEIPLSQIEVNPDQPRRDFDEEALNELGESIKQIGVIQPITLRKIADDRYQIIAGERRYRASLVAGLESIPAYVREATNEQVMEMALIENIQREDLNAIEIALSYQNLMEQCNYTQDKLGERVGKKRATVANYVRLLKLPADIQMALKERKIDMGHARALLGAENSVDQLQIYNRILEEGLTVRKVEELVRELGRDGDSENADSGSTIQEGKGGKKTTTELSEEYVVLRDRLSSMFESDVKLSVNKKGKGMITIPFKSDEDFAKIMELFDSMSDKTEGNNPEEGNFQ